MLDRFQQPSSQPTQLYNGVFGLIVINVIIFVLDHVLRLDLGFLYLNHNHPHWYQFITSTFAHANWAHLSGNLFFLYIFGRIIEESEGTLGLIGAYLITGLGANLFSVILQPGSIVSLGASGAVFGLFVVSVLSKLRWQWRNILEVVILGQFVLARVFEELQQVGIQDGINRIAHLGGALMGVLLVVGLLQLRNQKAQPQGSRDLSQ